MCAPHQQLLQGFGGIVDRGDDPETWLMNHNEALTAAEAGIDASELEHYKWILDGGEWPITLTDWYHVTTEANGNGTLCHRHTGEILLFAPDHDYSHIEVLDGCPEYSLYRIPATTTFVDWVEEIAQQWLGLVDLP